MCERGVYMQEKEYYASDWITPNYSCKTYRIEPRGTGFYLDEKYWFSDKYLFYILPIKE